MIDRGATGLGIANIALDGTVLDTWFPQPELSPPGQLPSSGTHRVGAQDLSQRMLSLVRLDEDRMVEQVAVRTTIADLSQPPVDQHDVYLRLHLLSHRLVQPLDINMSGALQLLATVVWTNKGPCLPDNFEYVRTALRSRGLIHVYAIDRLPRMVDYVVPTGVRIAEAERVRLGAYLAPGTSVLREGFVSFDSGTLGPAKIEGRLSYGVIIGEGTHVGLSASVLSKPDHSGTRHPVRIGRNCRLGVSSGVVGLSLGDGCVLGNNVVIEPETQLNFVEENAFRPASSIEGQSGWRITMEAHSPDPVARRQEPNPA